MEREEELEQTIDELNYDLTNAFEKIKRLESGIKRARAEIESAMNFGYATGDSRYADGFEKSLVIIDKHITESEV